MSAVLRLRSHFAVTLFVSAMSVTLGSSAVVTESAWADSGSNGKPVKPQTKITQTLSQATYKQMDLAQKAFEAKDYKGAESNLDVIKSRFDKLNDYEKATLWNLYAAVYRSEDDNKRAVDAYIQVLKQDNLPEGLRDNALFSLAQTYFLIEDYPRAIKVLDKWFAVVQEVQPDAYILYAQAYYQQQKYQEAKTPILKALSIAKQRNQPFKENWLGLLRAVYYELKDYPNTTKVMEVLVTAYPKDSYFLQLSGLYGLQGDQKKQLEVMHAAYLGGYVSKPSDLLNLARLYLSESAPERAVDLIKAKLQDKTLDLSVDNLQLFAQALSLAKDIEESVPVLVKLSSMSGESKHFNYLGQAYNQLGEWGKAADAFTAALHGKDVGNTENLQMQLGTALYNGGKLNEAKAAFQSASSSGAEHEAATNWVKFINTELERNQVLKSKS